MFNCILISATLKLEYKTSFNYVFLKTLKHNNITNTEKDKEKDCSHFGFNNK